MSTRCNIIIKDRRDKIILYHHHDGYPSGVGSDLKKYLATFQDWQIRQHGRWKIANDLVKNKLGEYGETAKAWTSEDAKGFIKVTSTALRAYYLAHPDERI